MIAQSKRTATPQIVNAFRRPVFAAALAVLVPLLAQTSRGAGTAALECRG